MLIKIKTLYRFANFLSMQVLKNVKKAIQQKGIILHQLVIFWDLPWCQQSQLCINWCHLLNVPSRHSLSGLTPIWQTKSNLFPWLLQYFSDQKETNKAKLTRDFHWFYQPESRIDIGCDYSPQEPERITRKTGWSSGHNQLYLVKSWSNNQRKRIPDDSLREKSEDYRSREEKKQDTPSKVEALLHIL